MKRLPEDERRAVLKEIFNKTFEKNSSAESYLISHRYWTALILLSTDIWTHWVRENSYFDACAVYF